VLKLKSEFKKQKKKRKREKNIFKKGIFGRGAQSAFKGLMIHVFANVVF
jgi:hypothetical protein